MSNALTGRSVDRISATASLLSFLTLLVLLLAGCDRGKVGNLKAENTKLKSELEKVQEQVKELAVKQKQDAAAREQDAAAREQGEAKRKQEGVEREQAEAKRKQELAEQKETAKREQEAKKTQSIDKCLDRIKLQMKSLMDEPRDFAFKKEAEREAIESRLKTLANSKQTDIGEIIIELKAWEFPSTSDLEFATRSFIRNYTSMIFYERLGYDYIEMGSDKHEGYSKKGLELMSLAHKDMSKIDLIWLDVRTKELDARGENAQAQVSTLNPVASTFSDLRTLAESGDADACFALARAYGAGNGVEKNFKEASNWFEKAAKKGHADAAYSLGTMYEYGLGIPEDRKLALEWYEVAANTGHARAKHALEGMQPK